MNTLTVLIYGIGITLLGRADSQTSPTFTIPAYVLAYLALIYWTFYRHDCSAAIQGHIQATSIHARPYTRSSSQSISMIIIGAGIGLRLFFLGFPASDDLNRYAWEGKLQSEGINPYRFAPSYFSTEAAHDAIYHGINHKELPAIYPPLAMVIFRLIFSWNYCPDSPMITFLIYKFILVIIDTCAMLILRSLLQTWQKPAHWLAFYAGNPLLLVYGIGEGHVDILQNFFIALSLWLYSRSRLGFCSVFFGCTTLIKYFAIILLPFLYQRKHLRKQLVLFLLPCLLFIPFWHSALFDCLRQFSESFHYLDFFPRILRLIFSPPLALKISLLIFALIYFWLWVTRECAPIKGMTYAWIWLLFCLPTVHPWYLLPLVVLLALNPYRPGFYLCLSMSLNFWISHNYRLTGIWEEPLIMSAIIYLPTLLWIVFEFRHISFPWHPNHAPPKSLDIIVPSLNEEANIRNFLTSLQVSCGYLQTSIHDVSDHQQNPTPNSGMNHIDVHVYLVDGGSHDKTLDIANDFAVTIRQINKASRGAQIAAGIKAGRGDLILILHADANINPKALWRLWQKYVQAPTLAWGILGHIYDDRSIKMRIIEWSNRYRFYYLGIAFGDQGIFIRRDILSAINGFPELELMEDVELSLRLADHPQRLLLGNQLVVSNRRWQRKKFSGYSTQVFIFVWIYLIGKRFGITTEKISRWLYSLYYK